MEVVFVMFNVTVVAISMAWLVIEFLYRPWHARCKFLTTIAEAKHSNPDSQRMPGKLAKFLFVADIVSKVWAIGNFLANDHWWFAAVMIMISTSSFVFQGVTAYEEWQKWG